jgi:hypothetical protein
MSMRHPISYPVAATAVVALLLLCGCEAPSTISGGVEGRARDVYSTDPNLGPPTQDAHARTATNPMGLDSAATNSPATQPSTAEAGTKANEQEAANNAGEPEE